MNTAVCLSVCVCVSDRSFLLDHRSFGAPCCREHDSAGETDPQVLLLQAKQLSAVLQRLTRLVLDGAAACKTRKRAKLVLNIHTHTYLSSIHTHSHQHVRSNSRFSILPEQPGM